MVHYTPTKNELEKNMEVISGMQDIAAHAVDTILIDPQTCCPVAGSVTSGSFTWNVPNCAVHVPLGLTVALASAS